MALRTEHDCVEIVISDEHCRYAHGHARRITGVYVDDDDRVRRDSDGALVVGCMVLREADIEHMRLRARFIRKTMQHSAYWQAVANIIDAEVG